MLLHGWMATNRSSKWIHRTWCSYLHLSLCYVVFSNLLVSGKFHPLRSPQAAGNKTCCNLPSMLNTVHCMVLLALKWISINNMSLEWKQCFLNHVANVVILYSEIHGNISKKKVEDGCQSHLTISVQHHSTCLRITLFETVYNMTFVAVTNNS